VATQTRTILTDDLDGNEGADTYACAWGGRQYEMDLTDQQRNDLLRALKPYIDAARDARSSSSSPAEKQVPTRGPGEMDWR
jgi:hypothetical protein